MKALLQRVTKASVKVDHNITGKIDNGLVVLLGVAVGDTYHDAEYLARKVSELRIFTDSEGKFNLSVKDVNGSVLAVSQFTLLADTRKGRRPGFTEAAKPDEAEKLFDYFIKELTNFGLSVKTGWFQTHMLVEIHNDGPVTIMLDSKTVRL